MSLTKLSLAGDRKIANLFYGVSPKNKKYFEGFFFSGIQ
jgi:hypothetical protein